MTTTPPAPRIRVASLAAGLLLTVLTGAVAMTTADDTPPPRPPSAMR